MCNNKLKDSSRFEFLLDLSSEIAFLTESPQESGMFSGDVMANQKFTSWRNSPRGIVMAWVCLSFLCLSFFSVAHAASVTFPYEASVIQDEVEVLSGPGSRFYATGKLKKGSPVTVHRHDPGGWYMIAPPPGSFSLVRAEYVKKESANAGVVTENQVVVRVGSQHGDEMDVEQRRLMKGDRVMILSEVQVEDRGRKLDMLRIQPPRGEFRWVKGDLLLPTDPQRRKSHDNDPFAVPSNGVEINGSVPVKKVPDSRDSLAEIPVMEKTVTEKKERPAPLPTASEDTWGKEQAAADSAPRPEEISKDQEILNALDRNFRKMIEQDISTWNIADLAHDYKTLQNKTTLAPIAHQIDLRFQAIERYRKIKLEYDDLLRLTNGTDRRDAQLLSLQQRTNWAHDHFPTENQVAEALPDPRVVAEGVGNGILPELPPGPAPAPVPGVGPYQEEGPRNPGQFSGAGIVQGVSRWNGTTPRYVLVTPQGKLLAYLHPVEGVQLEPLLGQAVGVYGDRRRNQELQADLIQVIGWQPVRLTP